MNFLKRAIRSLRSRSLGDEKTVEEKVLAVYLIRLNSNRTLLVGCPKSLRGVVAMQIIARVQLGLSTVAGSSGP